MKIIRTGSLTEPAILRGICDACGTIIEGDLSECIKKPSQPRILPCPLTGCGKMVAMSRNPALFPITLADQLKDAASQS